MIMQNIYIYIYIYIYILFKYIMALEELSCGYDRLIV